MRFLRALAIGTFLLCGCGGEEGEEAEDLAALCEEQQALGNNSGNQGRNHSHAQSLDDPCAELGPSNRQKKR